MRFRFLYNGLAVDGVVANEILEVDEIGMMAAVATPPGAEPTGIGFPFSSHGAPSTING